MMTDNKRKRDAAATREAILVAAKQVFTAKGFDGAGVRDIATLAGVNVALVNRYFGSKEKLFQEAVLPGVNIDDLMHGERARFGARVAAYFANKTHADNELDPTAAALRSISSDAVRAMLREAVDQAMIDKLAAWVGGDDAGIRAALIVSHLLGFDMLRRVAGVQALAPHQARRACDYFAAVLQYYVDGEPFADRDRSPQD